MSIATRTGDNGTTGLMYNRRVSKCHPRVEAYGTVDELNTALGLVRATTPHAFVRDTILPIQKDLVTVMGELATAVDDLPRYVSDGYPTVHASLTEKLDAVVAQLESQEITYKGWATPGATPDAAALDIARTTTRRAERRVCALQEADQLRNPEIIVFLNRLADLLWLMARWVETRTEAREVRGASAMA
ncbi:MAG: cob(I)yrinic acid a,c-diamide adenosyltransferase [Verrucomicrobiales bacterium]|nr:cob(I)yrinic acid a,c-diamide adenosyltransferase [Verrucomicrobiales bacterium]